MTGKTFGDHLDRRQEVEEEPTRAALTLRGLARPAMRAHQAHEI